MHLLSPRRRAFLQGLGAASLLTACGGTAVGSSVQSAEFSGFTMGSMYRVKIAGRRLSEAVRAAAADAVAAALAGVDHAMSTHRPHSELSRFNAHASTAPFALSADTLAVFELARDVSAATAGAFDVTVG